jgi:metal-dependent phosphohydrolase
MKDLFKNYAANSNNLKWANMIKREEKLYSRGNDIRSEFERDYTRVIHSNAYRRQKHKTQVFFSPENDHICTRIEHVTYVESISYTIAKYLGLNVELTRAIAIAHDIGHSPFGHQGEKILSEISKRDLGKTFWHEKNGLEFVDKIELLEDKSKNMQNLNLTYAVRDGIISHCGEIDENKLKPRDEYIDLNSYSKPNQYAPYTWEGCVVKIADKISYLGRDIEDAITLGILDEHLDDLYKILNKNKSEVINNTVIINSLIYDLCNNSSPEKGLCFSEEIFELIKEIKDFNYKYIYLSERLKPSTKYFELVLNQIYDTLNNSKKNLKRFYPELFKDFEDWLSYYWNLPRNKNAKNKAIFDLNDRKSYSQAIIYYIAGMTDNYAIDMYNKIVGF